MLGSMGRLDHTPALEKYACWSLLAGQELINKVTRVGLPYIVPFIAAEYGFSEAQRASLLTAFTAGYITCQVPGGYIAEALGPKFVLLCNNIGLVALLGLLPRLANLGPGAVWCALAGVGVLQGPHMIGHHGMTQVRHPGPPCCHAPPAHCGSIVGGPPFPFLWPRRTGRRRPARPTVRRRT